jgi:hypothetical protein
LLTHAGYTVVANMQGGFGGARDAGGRELVAGWTQSGLPVCSDCDDQDSYAILRSAAA